MVLMIVVIGGMVGGVVFVVLFVILVVILIKLVLINFFKGEGYILYVYMLINDLFIGIN